MGGRLHDDILLAHLVAHVGCDKSHGSQLKFPRRMEDFSENLLNEVQLDWIFLFLTVLYAVDLLVRFYGLGFKSFKSNGWNIFDLIVITGSFATTIPALQADSSGGAANQANVQLQKLFLVSISLKLVQRISSLNQLFKTSM